MITVQEAVEEFLLACHTDLLSNETVKWYRYVLRPFAARMIDVTVDQVEVGVIRQYLADLRGQTTKYRGARQRPEERGGLSLETIRGRMRALARFFKWSQQEYRLDAATNPMLRIRIPRRGSQQPKAIALDDLRKLLEATGDSVRGKRDRAMLAFLADTGCRASGMLTLKLEGLFLDQGRAIVHEKGDRTRVVPFTRYTAALVADWLAVRPESETVFCSLATDEHFAGQLTVSGLNQVIRRLMKKAGVTGRCNPHSFRHGFARAYLENGGDLATLQQLMGHSNVSTTVSFYAVFTGPELARRHEMYSPLKGLMKGGEGE